MPSRRDCTSNRLHVINKFQHQQFKYSSTIRDLGAPSTDLQHDNKVSYSCSIALKADKAKSVDEGRTRFSCLRDESPHRGRPRQDGHGSKEDRQDLCGRNSKSFNDLQRRLRDPSRPVSSRWLPLLVRSRRMGRAPIGCCACMFLLQ